MKAVDRIIIEKKSFLEELAQDSEQQEKICRAANNLENTITSGNQVYVLVEDDIHALSLYMMHLFEKYVSDIMPDSEILGISSEEIRLGEAEAQDCIIAWGDYSEELAQYYKDYNWIFFNSPSADVLPVDEHLVVFKCGEDVEESTLLLTDVIFELVGIKLSPKL